MFCDDSENAYITYEVSNKRWQVGVVFNPDAGYQHISYVNGICTFQGGSHVNHVADQIVKKLSQQIKIKHKDLNVKPAYIKNNLTIF